MHGAVITGMVPQLTCHCAPPAPAVLGYLPMWMAVLLHEGATLLVAANSLRALHVPRAETAQGTQAAPEAATALA